jgi:hypothetical protein
MSLTTPILAPRFMDRRECLGYIRVDEAGIGFPLDLVGRLGEFGIKPRVLEQPHRLRRSAAIFGAAFVLVI